MENGLKKDVVKIVEKKWGREEIVVATELYTLKYLHLKKDYQCSTHHHVKKDETFFFQKGIVVLKVGEFERVCVPGTSIRIPPGTRHSFRGITDAIIIEVSTEDIESDSIRSTKEPSRYVGAFV